MPSPQYARSSEARPEGHFFLRALEHAARSVFVTKPLTPTYRPGKFPNKIIAEVSVNNGELVIFPIQLDIPNEIPVTGEISPPHQAILDVVTMVTAQHLLELLHFGNGQSFIDGSAFVHCHADTDGPISDKPSANAKDQAVDTSKFESRASLSQLGVSRIGLAIAFAETPTRDPRLTQRIGKCAQLANMRSLLTAAKGGSVLSVPEADYVRLGSDE